MGIFGKSQGGMGEGHETNGPGKKPPPPPKWKPSKDNIKPPPPPRRKGK